MNRSSPHLLSITVLVLALPLALAQPPASICPLISGVRTCVPVLEQCAACTSPRGPSDPVCAESLVCEDSECRGVGLNKLCGKENGKACDEGLVCITKQRSWFAGIQTAVCFTAGAEGESCETSEQKITLSQDSASDPRFRRTCAPGLLCVNDVCVVDDGRVEECNPGGCQRQNEVCSVGTSMRKCEAVTPFGASCATGDRCERGPYRSPASCIDGAGGAKCRSVASAAGAVCGEMRVCATAALRSDAIVGNFFRDGPDFMCEEGYCAEKGDGGLFRVCGGDGECAEGRACARAGDGAMRCLDRIQGPGDMFGADGGCALASQPSEYSRIESLATKICDAGFSCEASFTLAQRGLDRGLCKKDEIVPVGGTCSFFSRCVDADDEGRDVFCQRLPSSNDGVCVLLLREGESCATTNGRCGPGGENEFGSGDLRDASCDGSNVCRITDAKSSCTIDGDCDSAAGESCVRPTESVSNQKRCWKYNQQPGQSCSVDSSFGRDWNEACADGLKCYVSVGEHNRWTSKGRCVSFVKDGERCSAEENILCRGQQFSPVRSVCNSGTCRQYLGPYE